jgi:hypothetical protein
LLVCLANRAACFLCLFNFQECISDADTFIGAYLSNPVEKLLRPYLKTLLRRALAYAWNGYLMKAKTLLGEVVVAAEHTLHAEEFAS